MMYNVGLFNVLIAFDRGKEIVLWAYGDLEFLGKAYGICACNGKLHA